MNQSKTFTKINIEISNICNLQCSFCPEVVRSKGFIEVPLFRNIIEQVEPLTEQVCFHLMGEPLTHPRLPELVGICHELQVPIFLVSNGVLLREKHIELLLHPAFRQVNFSLHSFHDNFPDRDSTPYLQRIFDFTERAFELRPDLYINYRLWNLSDPRGSGERNRAMLDQIEARFGTKVNPNLDVRIQKSRRLKNRLYMHFDTEFTWPALDLEVLGDRGTCQGLSNHFGILIDGSVVPCCLDKEGVISLGNVKDQTIQDILAGPRAQSMLIGFRNGRLKEELCRRCQYIERFGAAKSAAFGEVRASEEDGLGKQAVH